MKAADTELYHMLLFIEAMCPNSSCCKLLAGMELVPATSAPESQAGIDFRRAAGCKQTQTRAVFVRACETAIVLATWEERHPRLSK